METNARAELLAGLDRLHTTELGLLRIKRNLSLTEADVVDWCKRQIESPGSRISRKGKNWYIQAEGVLITVNAHSATIITARRVNG